ncbi:MAG: hypothetical protein OXC02_06235 [Rhodobacteraceae bacterium]|nr:hypothetical protein [Paracoccaceae bacterium]
MLEIAALVVGLISSLCIVVLAIFSISNSLWKIPSWAKGVEKDIEYLTKSIDEFKNETNKKFDRIFDQLTAKPIFESKSPFTLNELGEKISKELDAEQIAGTIIGELVDGMRGKTPYEIQELSMNFVQTQYVPNEYDPKKMQDCAYNNGTGMNQVKDVIAIKLRDAIFEELRIPVPNKD